MADDEDKQFLQLLKLAPAILRIVIMLSYLFAFTLLVGGDAIRAFRKRAHSIPGNALALSALTIQALAFVGLGFVDTSNEPQPRQYRILLHFQLFVDGGRLSMCIFLAYILPRMVGSRSAKDLRLILALAISLFVQILYEIYYVYRAQEVPEIRTYIEGRAHRRWYVFWFKLSTNLLFMSMIFLVSAITCAVIAGKTVRRLLNQRLAVIFSRANEIHTSEAENSKKDRSKKCTWMDFEDEVFKSWVVSRVTQPDYVMARSALNSAAALVVTLCTFFSIFKTLWIMQHYGENFKSYFYSVSDEYTRIWIWLQVCAVCSFFTVGWVVICWRWITAVFFFPKLTGTRKRFFYVENFWINSIIELRNVCEIESLRLRTHSTTDITSLVIKIVAKMRLHKLLYVVCMLQISVVLFSKICHLLSEMVCMLLQFIINLVVVRIRLPGNNDHREASDESVYSSRFEHFKDSLEHICMPGEDPAFLWKANISSIKQIERRIKEGWEKGGIVEFVKSEFRPQCIDQGLHFLSKLRDKSLPQVDKYFPDLKNPCWKMTAVSLLSLLIELHGENSALIMPFIKECEDVWDMLSFADNADIEADRLKLIDSYDTDAHQVSMAADEEFYKIQRASRKVRVPSKSHADVERVVVEKQRTQAVALLKAQHIPLENGEENASTENYSALHDSVDWRKIAHQYSLYKLLMVMEGENLNGLIGWAEVSLRNIIAACLSKLPHIILEHARQCVLEFDEDSLWNTVYIAGKTKGVWEALGLLPILKMKQNGEMEWLLEVTEDRETSNPN